MVIFYTQNINIRRTEKLINWSICHTDCFLVSVIIYHTLTVYIHVPMFAFFEKNFGFSPREQKKSLRKLWWLLGFELMHFRCFLLSLKIWTFHQELMSVKQSKTISNIPLIKKVCFQKLFLKSVYHWSKISEIPCVCVLW